MRDLQNRYIDCPLIQSDSYVCYKETVSSTSQGCLAKSSNKHNRLCVKKVRRKLSSTL